jgi:hypothetical protein
MNQKTQKDYEKAYYDVADALCRESTGTEDLCRQARQLRKDLAEARRIAEAYRYVLQVVSSAVDTCLNTDPPPPCLASWPHGVSVTIGSRWQTKETPRLRGTLFAVNCQENTVSLQLEETEDFRGGLANKLTWVSSYQDLCGKWECLSDESHRPLPGASDANTKGSEL